MQLDETARERLEDIRDLQPTSNSELRDRWGMDSGKEVAAYLRDELGKHTYRDDDSRIRAVDASPDSAGDGEAELSASNPTPSVPVEHRNSDTTAPREGYTSSGPDESRESGAKQQQSPSESTPANDSMEDVVTTPVATEMLELTAADAYADGYNEAIETVHNPSTKEHNNGDGQKHSGECPTCGDPLVFPGAGSIYDTNERIGGLFIQRYAKVQLEADDMYCHDCDLIVASDGDAIPGPDYVPPALR